MVAALERDIYANVIAVIGKESAGKSQLIASLTGRQAYSANFRGSTLSCELYEEPDGRTFVDTPGICRHSDTQTTLAALARLEESEVALVVVQATNIDSDLHDLLPLAKGKLGAVIVTFWDRIAALEGVEGRDRLRQVEQVTGVPVIPLDARRLDAAQKSAVFAAIDAPRRFMSDVLPVGIGWKLEPRATLLEHRRLGPWIASLLLLMPAILAIWCANRFAGALEPVVNGLTARIAERFGALSPLPRDVLIGPYGLVTMGPLLFLWAVPTVAVYAFGLGVYKASGLLDRITAAMHPIMRPFGLTGRDLVRVMMGLGCNVPAVISTRACSSCSRSTAITAIAFGSACSYQLGATLAVFGAAGHPSLVFPYLAYLTFTTLVFLRLTASRQARSPLNVLMAGAQTFLTWPRGASIWREARLTLLHFFRTAIPIFLVITVFASVLDWLGVLRSLASILSPAMALFHLPPEAALPVVLSSIRKDGLLLFAQPETLKALSGVQILTGVYLAGVLLPCLVTALTIAREQSSRFVLLLMLRQAVAACVFAAVLAWGGALLWR